MEVETQSTAYTDLQWSPEAGYTYVVEAINRAGHSAHHPTVAAEPRQVWNLTNNLPWDGTGEGDSLADPDADGIVNLAEYLHGLNPRALDSQSPVAIEAFDEHSFSVRYRRNPAATGVQEHVEWTTDLASGVWTTNGVSTTDMSGPWQGWKAATAPVESNQPAKFLRLIIRE
jgi:hypothetical protein